MFNVQAVLATDDGLVPGWLTVSDGLITATETGSVAPQPALDLGQHVLAPGFVDVHVHGGAGGQAAGADSARVAEQVIRAARFHATHGTTRLVATTISDTPARLLATVAGIREALERADPAAASIAGVHLEGPWLSPARRGAHDSRTLRLPDVAELDALVEASGGQIRLLTIAPELPGAEAVIRWAAAGGIVVSVGHTEATYAQSASAFAAGARHLTHLGNAMRPVDRREPGPIGAALADERVTVEVIADGEHVHPAVLRLAVAAAPGRVVAITDAIAATGLPDGEHLLGALPVTVAAGRAVLARAPETLAGSVLTMDRAVATLIAAGVSPHAALAAASATPARVLGEHAVRGRLTPGTAADLVVLDDGWTARATLIGGRVVHDPDGLLATGPATRA